MRYVPLAILLIAGCASHEPDPGSLEAIKKEAAHEQYRNAFRRCIRTLTSVERAHIHGRGEIYYGSTQDDKFSRCSRQAANASNYK